MDYKKILKDGVELIQEDPVGAFEKISNAQRFVSKNILRNRRPIRYLKRGEIHVPNHGFTGPQTRLDLAEVRNFPPYNNIDACSRTHDFQFNEIFKMPEGPERRQAIRNADKEAIECYDKYPNEDGYRLAKMGINNKMRLEDLSPQLFNMIMGEAYRGAEEVIQEGGAEKIIQEGGEDELLPFVYALGLGGTALGIGEYYIGKAIYNKLKGSKNKN